LTSGSTAHIPRIHHAQPRLAGVTFYLNGGDVPIASAVAALVA
jgi:hypothetical protein